MHLEEQQKCGHVQLEISQVCMLVFPTKDWQQDNLHR